jgi:hypothetical protein
MPGWSYRSDGRKGRGNQGPCQIDRGRLNAGMAEGTSSGIRVRLVVVEQASEECENEDRNNNKFFDWDLSPGAHF